MAEPTLESRIAAASSFILQSPPGEVNDVFNDVRPLIGDDEALEKGLAPALKKYNLEQFTVIEVPGFTEPALICPAALITPSTSSTPDAPDRYLQPSTSQTFNFDHLRLTASSVEPVELVHLHGAEDEEFRKALEAEVGKYLAERFEGGVAGVFVVREGGLKVPEVGGEAAGAPVVTPVHEEKEVEKEEGEKEEGAEGEAKEEAEEDGDEKPPESEAKAEEKPATPSEAPTPAPAAAPALTPSKRYRIHLVGNKYNPSNYWTGRWRSTYDIDLEKSEIKGNIMINVHYYEQGNVQLATHHTPQLSLPNSSPTPTQILKLINDTEQSYQTSINLTYQDLGDKAFKSLRRALPVTKMKIEWNKLGLYKMGGPGAQGGVAGLVGGVGGR